MHLPSFLHRFLDRDMNGIVAREPQSAKTLVSVVYVTAPKTFDGPAIYVTQNAVAGAAVQQTARPDTNTPSSNDAQPTQSAAPTSSEDDNDDNDDETTSAAPSSTSQPTTTQQQSHSSAAASSQTPSTTALGKIATPTGSAGVTHTSASVTAASATDSPDSSRPSGMSGGAKAGLTFGILVAVAAVLAIILILYRKKKRENQGRRLSDDEKGHLASNRLPPASHMSNSTMATGSIRTARTMSTAPRLSLRPVTEFHPNIAGERKSGGNLLGSALGAGAAAGAAGAAASRTDHRGMLRPNQQQPVSAWERRGAQANATSPENPFGSHAEVADAPSNARTQAPLPEPPRAPSPEVTPEAFPVPGTATATPKAMSVKSDMTGGSALASPSFVESGETPSSLMPGAAAAAGAAAMGTAAAGSKGSAVPVAVGPNNVHRVQLDFKPTMDDELGIRAGQLVRVLHDYDDGWALCVRMDRSQQGVVPRTCLSKNPVKPRPSGPPPGHPRAPPPMHGPPPMGSPRAPGSPMGPGPYGSPSPLSPAGTPGTYSPASSAPHSRHHSRSHSGPGLQNRGRSHSNVAPYPPSLAPGGGRSMSPGPYGPGQGRPPQGMRPRPRSNSMGNVGPRHTPKDPHGQSRIPVAAAGAIPARKPVPGQAM